MYVNIYNGSHEFESDHRRSYMRGVKGKKGKGTSIVLILK